MKLKFKKDDKSQISVVHLTDGKESEFSYVKMIKSLISTNHMEPPEITEGFTKAEISSITSMVGLINKEIKRE